MTGALALSGKAKIAGVMGWPVGHSRSPALHGFWLRAHGIDGAYVPLPVRPEHLQPALKALPLLGFVGVSLTVPHKEAALAVLDRVDPTAQRIGAVNTVVVGADGSLEGRNTDAYGFAANLAAGAPHLTLAGATAVVFGAGGAARAVCVSLIESGCKAIRILNRSRARADKMAEDLGGPLASIEWSAYAEAFVGADLLVNTTSLGMTGQPHLDVDLRNLPPSAVVTDIVYTPLQTSFLKTAAARGHAVVDGLGMLLYQAQPAFTAWFGVRPDVTAALRHHVLPQPA